MTFTGREADGTELLYYRARYYDPRKQRFFSEDPAGFGGGSTNLFEYVKNQPTTLIDPFGTNSAGVTVMKILHACDWHRYRNLENRCPQKEPTNDPTWSKDRWGSGKYRNADGSECKYNKCGMLLPDERGNYTYNYGPDPFTPAHLWYDVLPHFYCGPYFPDLTKPR